MAELIAGFLNLLQVAVVQDDVTLVALRRYCVAQESE